MRNSENSPGDRGGFGDYEQKRKTNMKKVVVTGANGFIGTALCRKLAQQGGTVIAVVKNEDENVSALEQIPRLRIVYCDLALFGRLAQFIPDRDIDVVYHLAWMGSAGPLRGDSGVQTDNIRYTCDLVKSCADLKCRKIVFASSIMEYEIQALMETERVPGRNTLYSSAKAAANHMARTMAGEFHLDYIRALLSNVFGPGEKSPRLINTCLRKLLQGEHCAFSSGEQMYDFIYIEDAVEILAAIGERGVSNKTYYIGSQNPRPLKEFLYELRDQVDPGAEIGLGELPFEGVSLTYREFDINAVKEDTGIVPRVSFSQGIQNTVRWMKGNKTDESISD